VVFSRQPKLLPGAYFTLGPANPANVLFTVGAGNLLMPQTFAPPLPEALRCTWREHHRGTPAEPLVRDWLAAELGCAGRDIVLTRDAHGRPRLNGLHAAFDVSWSHSGDGLLVALGAGIEVGVDLERLRPRPRALELAQRFFHAAEAAWLAGLPEGVRDIAFIRLWCAKEAVLKAHGRGIAFGLDKFELAEDLGALAMSSGPVALGGPWSLREWEPRPGYRAALAWRPALQSM
jgi:4'-phosphopantetheinyl transferase